MFTTDPTDTGVHPPGTPAIHQNIMPDTIEDLRNIDPRKCDRRQLVQVVNMLKARTQDQQRVLDGTLVPVLNQHITWTDRLRDHLDCQRMIVQNRKSEVDRMERKAEIYQQEKKLMEAKLNSSKDMFVEQMKVHDSLLAQIEQLRKRIKTLLDEGAKKGITEAIVETYEGIKNDLLYEQRCEEYIQKKADWSKKLHKLLTTMKEYYLSSPPNEQYRFKISCVDRDGTADIICTDVSFPGQIDPRISRAIVEGVLGIELKVASSEYCAGDGNHVLNNDDTQNNVMSINNEARAMRATDDVFENQIDEKGMKTVGVSSRQL